MGLRFILDGRDDTRVVGEGATASDVKRLAALGPDLFLLDLMLADGTGMENIREIHVISPKTRVLVLSMLDETLYAERCIRAGASGYSAERGR